MVKKGEVIYQKQNNFKKIKNFCDQKHTMLAKKIFIKTSFGVWTIVIVIITFSFDRSRIKFVLSVDLNDLCITLIVIFYFIDFLLIICNFHQRGDVMVGWIEKEHISGQIQRARNLQILLNRFCKLSFPHIRAKIDDSSFGYSKT